jgi:hypothetical protein
VLEPRTDLGIRFGIGGGGGGNCVGLAASDVVADGFAHVAISVLFYNQLECT